MALGSMLVNRGGAIRLVAAGVRSDALAATEKISTVVRVERTSTSSPVSAVRARSGHAVRCRHPMVDFSARCPACCSFKAFPRQRSQRRPVQFLKEAGPAAWALAKRPLIEFME